MIIKNVELETVCGITSKLPENQLPEVAFAGKSNVGKSSLINALVNRKSLARTSVSRERPRLLTFIMSIKKCTSWICRDTVMRKYQRKWRQSGDR